MNLHLHIDHLVLEGLPVREEHGAAVRAALEAELTRLLAGGGVPPLLRDGGAYAAVRTGDIQLNGNESPAALGQQIGRAVHGGISR
jgi:hypothetical protein